ncbi:MAG TPA: hypothetical protein VMP42_08800 [Actinomycetota bacterium]|nr:hypothetical protein [Actinomycetota bacterium]
MGGHLDTRYRWFVGLSEPEALAEVVDHLERRRGFLLAHWGTKDLAGPEAGVRVEVGDRAYREMLRESEGGPHERMDPILERAVRAAPVSLLDLL